MLYVILSSVIVFAAILLVVVVLFQKSKGGGLASNFASSNQILGVRKTTDFVEKATWGFAGFIVLLCVITSLSSGAGQVEVPGDESAISAEVENAFKVDPTLVKPNLDAAAQDAQPTEE